MHCFPEKYRQGYYKALSVMPFFKHRWVNQRLLSSFLKYSSYHCFQSVMTITRLFNLLFLTSLAVVIFYILVGSVKINTDEQVFFKCKIGWEKSFTNNRWGKYPTLPWKIILNVSKHCHLMCINFQGLFWCDVILM